MESRAWSRAAELLDRLFAMSRDDRSAMLSKLAGQDPELARCLGAALAVDEARVPILDEPFTLVLGDPAEPAQPPPDAATPGTRIGVWTLERSLGRGGMGEVWLAHRADEQYRLDVAIKLVDTLRDSELLREQLRRERQILADLDHPQIARLIDGGVRENGTPWYAMEYVEGQPLDEYCARSGLAIDQRLGLLASVARAVHHAHTRLVVHRDLKPGNILVDADGAPHLVDFGIAKLLESGAGNRAGAVTLLGASTPEYAAPEQARGRSVGTGADIYALGVIAFELVAGRPPPREDGAREDPNHGPLPSRAFEGSRRRRAAVRGDIDAIVAQAMAPDPSARYASAEALADDIERHLQGHPVLARHAGAVYRLRKFVCRHWLGVGMGTAALISLCVALAVSIVQTNRAEVALERANAVQAFLLGVFESAEPAPGDSGIMTRRDLAERAVRQLDRVLASQPQTRIDVLIAVGRVFRKMGFAERSQTLLAGAVAALDAAGAHHDDPRRVDALYELGRADYYADDFAAAVDHLSQADRIAARTGVPPARRAAILFELGSSYSALHQIDPALAVLDAAAALALESPGAGALIPRIRLLTALTYRRTGRLDRAMPAGLEAVESARRHLGEQHVRTAGALSTVGAIFRRAGRLDVAETMLREALEIERVAYGQPQSATVNNLASILRDRGRLDESGRLFREALDRAVARHGPDSASTASYRRNLALQQALSGELEQAVANLRLAYRQYAAEHGIATLPNLNMRSQLARVLEQAGRVDEAAELLPEIFELAPEYGPPGQPVLIRAHMVAAALALERDDRVQARGHADAIMRMLRTVNPENEDFVRVHLVLGDVAVVHGNRTRGRDHWQTAHDAAVNRLDPDHPLAGAAADRLGDY